MISTLTAMRTFERAPGLFIWVLGAVAWVLAAALVVRVAREVAEWLRMWWVLRDVPKPKPQKSFTLLLDLYKQLSAMDPKMDVKVKAFKYLANLFKSVEDQDVTVAFYGPYAFLLGATPPVVEAILGDTKNVNKAFFYNMMKPWIGKGILTLGDEPWKTRRRAITPAFHFRILDDYVPIMNKRGERLMQKVTAMNGEYFDVLPIVRAAAFGVLFETSMGIDYDEDDIERTGYLRIHDAISDTVVDRVINFHHWFDTIYAFSKERKRMLQYVEEAKEFVNNILQKRIVDYRKGIRDPVSKNSFLEILLRMYLDEGIMTEIDVRDELLSTLIGGFDTTATSLAYTLYLLGHHPEIQAKVQEEIDLVCGDDWDKPPTAEELKNLTYMECVLKEAMRLYPPGSVIGRSVVKDIKIGKYTIPRGTVAVVALYFLQRHPRYVEDPNSFKPERFMEAKSMHNFGFAPFSAGPRNCLGQKFALREEKILLTHVIRRFNVTSKVPIDKLELAMELILKPIQGLEIKLTPREHPSSK
ncbi:cytochrome P450 4V2 [Rhipicephalus microplus]|uniref:cytochrome P450 4V2 n=1 Tax=Rhipicephalus microplus TaxID=6941 RepID=UPI003F6ABD96